MSDLSHILKDMNDQQREKLSQQIKAPILFMLAQGTGKTTVIARRFAYFIV
ncbi:hypothetical protein AGMMS5026_05570 [Endomicrobiia bacterium]|nr:hypothetical protein AGMMS49523_08890 [Endomicrobiia bacterium]GHT14056.1 hypothetical protein AGMMS49571_08950 [Endomicrobiia bacterium]GHT21530.1 hypothetical protein AGMMS49929_10170 [Endomicrobiia bacterium]GHT27958.1 hypothetical protein AGMMS49995_07930 [Endomicrobiia bacterium]GHT30692.1 hypothetical protein AGMMS5026_05570 [Endomicrobiia bacterium]